MAAAAVTPPPLFGTVLVARTPQDSPSPLELQMRNSSARLRIVQKLSGGAHLLLPGSETTIAIRVYFSKDLNEHMNDDDGLAAFRNAFKYPIVFFILPLGAAQQEQLSNPLSFLSLAQLIMISRDGTAGQQMEGCGRVFIVPDVTSAINILSSVVQTLTPARRDLKKQFHNAIKSKNFVGDTSSSKAAAATHVTTAFRDFANRFELPIGEDDVLLSRLDSISGIATADLSSAPVYDSTKDKLTAFFGSHHGRQMQDANGMPHSNNQQQMNNMQMGMGMQEPYASHAPPYGSMNAGAPASFQQQQSSNAFRTPPRDSMIGMVPTEGEGFAHFDTWQEPPENNMRATPQLVNQQFAPRQQHAGHPMQMYNQGPLANDGTRQLLPQFNRQGPMGNPVRPFSAYSANGGEGMGDYYR